MMRSIKQFFGYGILFVAIGVAVLYGTEHVRYKNSPEYRAEKDMEKLTKQYAEDPYGGNTPEETLALFISALKQGDTDLAAKYFILDKQEQWKNDLLEIKERGLLDEMVRDLELANRGKDLSIDTTRFTITNENNEVITIVSISQISNSKWKLIDF